MNCLFLFLVFTLGQATHILTSVNNTVGIFYNGISQLRISNTNWTLLVFKDLRTIKEALDHNNNLLESMHNMLNGGDERKKNFTISVMTHLSSLKNISNSAVVRYNEIMKMTEQSLHKRGLHNGSRTVFNSITGNLDNSDGEYYIECINELNKDDRHIENLMKKQISVTTPIFKKFNETIHKLKINEENFNNDMSQIERDIYNIGDTVNYYKPRLAVLYFCETLTESYTILLEELNDVSNAIKFAQMKIIDESIIVPKDLIAALQDISRKLTKDNLPLPISVPNMATYFNLIELTSFQQGSKIVFVLKIPLIRPESYVLYKVSPMPIPDVRTGLHHLVLVNQHYIANDEELLHYVSFRNMSICKDLTENTKICENLLPVPIDKDAICEAQLLTEVMQMPKVCVPSFMFATGYKVESIARNTWLIITSQQLSANIKCKREGNFTKIINQNSILQLEQDCSAFIGSTRVNSTTGVGNFSNVIYRNHPIGIPYDCCNHLPSKWNIPKLKPLELRTIDAYELSMSENMLNLYSEEFDKMMDEPFINKNASRSGFFSITAVTIFIIVITVLVLLKWKRKRNFNPLKQRWELIERELEHESFSVTLEK